MQDDTLLHKVAQPEGLEISRASNALTALSCGGLHRMALDPPALAAAFRVDVKHSAQAARRSP